MSGDMQDLPVRKIWQFRLILQDMIRPDPGVKQDRFQFDLFAVGNPAGQITVDFMLQQSPRAVIPFIDTGMGGNGNFMFIAPHRSTAGMVGMTVGDHHQFYIIYRSFEHILTVIFDSFHISDGTRVQQQHPPIIFRQE